MPEIGQVSTLRVSSEGRGGYYLDGGKLGEIFLPLRQAPKHCDVDQQLQVFIHHHNDGSLIASTQLPHAQLGNVAFLTVSEVNQIGAFLDWGLDKELLLPYAEQLGTVAPNSKVLVKIYMDSSQRLVASMRLDEFIEDYAEHFKTDQAVNIIIGNKTELGVKAVIENEYWGLLYDNELPQAVHRGQRYTAYVKKLRDDQRIDLSLHKPRGKSTGIHDDILQKLADNNGFLALGDKSPPAMIYQEFAVSKKVFKQAISQLYKQRLIVIATDGIRLISDDD